MELQGIAVCGRCQTKITKAAYEVRAGAEKASRCLRCVMVFRPLVVRSVAVAFVVGTILTAINQGNVILSGDGSPSLAWKVPLTYAVPYCVAMLGALMNARSSTPSESGA